MARKKTGSIDDITPEQWNEMNRLHLQEMHGGDVDLDGTVSITLSDVTSDPWVVSSPVKIHVSRDHRELAGEKW